MGHGAIVMLDDSESDLLIATRCYERSSLENPWRTFTDQDTFLDWLERVRQGQDVGPVLVLLDINMRGKSGFDVLEWVRAQPEFETVPVVMMLTNSDAQTDRARAREMGADGFRTKPARLADYVSLFDGLSEFVKAA